jgi:hypothetical protein
MSSDLATAVDNLLIGEYGSQGLAPPDRCLIDVGEALGIPKGSPAGFECVTLFETGRRSRIKLRRIL